MRAHGIPDAYDRLKAFTRGRPIDEPAMREFIASLDLPAEEKERLLELTPGTYVGLAPRLALRGRPRRRRRPSSFAPPKRDAVSTMPPNANGTIRLKATRGQGLASYGG